MIKLQIVGNLGKDCIVKDVNGKKVINFSVAHTDKFKDGLGNVKEKTTWVECAYWNDKSTVGEYLKKGTMVYVEGSPDVDAYSNKEGNPAATLRMRVHSLQLLGGSDRQSNDSPYDKGKVTNTGNTNNPTMKVESDSVPNNQPAHAPVADGGGTDDLPF